MTKDERIAFLETQVVSLTATVEELQADKDRLLDMLQLALGPKPQSASTERTRRWRERHRDGHSDGHSDASRERLPLERVNLPILDQGNDQDVTPDARKQVDHTLSEPGTSRERHRDAFDRERAEADAAERGLTGAAFEAELQHFTDYWESAGWKRKNGPVKDRNATWRTWLDSPYRKPATTGGNHRNAPDFSGIEEFTQFLADRGVA